MCNSWKDHALTGRGNLEKTVDKMLRNKPLNIVHYRSL
jgi:hypothetical protein